MAIVSKFSHASATVDLNDTSTGFSLSGDGWLPAVATPLYKRDPEPVVETLHLRLKDTSQDNISTDMQALHAMQVLAEDYINDPTVEDPVWLHAKMDSETGERRAVVYKIEVQYGSSWYGDEATALDIPVTLSVTRGPYWESTTARDLPADTGATGMVYAYNYTASGASVDAHDIVGDVGARIRLFDIDPVAGNRDTYWMGIRSAGKRGATGISNFDSLWEFEDGTNSTDVTDTVDTGASGGSKIVVAESAEEWDNEWNQISYQTVAAVSNPNEGDQIGQYLGLVRAKVTSGTWEIQAQYGNFGGDYRKGRIIEISETVWTVFDTDIYTIPIWDARSFTTDDIAASTLAGNFAITIRGRRTSGTGNLELDCWVPVPVDEGFAKLYQNNAENLLNTYFAESPTGVIESYIGSFKGTVGTNEFRLPPGDGRMYIVSTISATDHDISATTSINDNDKGKYYERWLSLRGNE